MAMHSSLVNDVVNSSGLLDYLHELDARRARQVCKLWKAAAPRMSELLVVCESSSNKLHLVDTRTGAT